MFRFSGNFRYSGVPAFSTSNPIEERSKFVVVLSQVWKGEGKDSKNRGTIFKTKLIQS